MRRVIALGLGAITLLVAGALAAVYLLTEQPGSGAARARPVAQPAVEPALAAEAQAALAPPPPPAPAVIGSAAPTVDPLPEYHAPAVPLSNSAPTIQTQPVIELPEDPTDRQDALLELRRRKFAAQMEQLNRRNAARVGQPAPAPPPPPVRGAPGSRRGALSPPAPGDQPDDSASP